MRFLLPAVAASLIVLAVSVTRTGPAARAAILAAAAAAVLGANPHFLAQAQRGFLSDAAFKLRAAEARYTLGGESEDAYLTRHFGCQYRAVEYLRDHGLRGGVVDNWTISHDPNVPLFSGENRFTSFAPGTRDPARVWARLRATGLRYLYVRADTKRRVLAEPGALAAAYRRAREPVEELLLRSSDPLWSERDCRLFRIRPSAPR